MNHGDLCDLFLFERIMTDVRIETEDKLKFQKYFEMAKLKT